MIEPELDEVHVYGVFCDDRKVGLLVINTLDATQKIDSQNQYNQDGEFVGAAEYNPRVLLEIKATLYPNTDFDTSVFDEPKPQLTNHNEQIQDIQQ